MKVTRHDSDQSWWEMVRRPAPAPLAAHVSSYLSYEERTAAPLQRREVPIGRVVLILSFGDPIEIVEMHNGPRSNGPVTSFVAGMHDGFTVTRQAGRQHGIQLDLTPLGAYRLLGVPMCEIANQVVELDVLCGRRVVELTDQLAAAPSWAERFALLDRTLWSWGADGPEAEPAVAWAWRQLDGAKGQVPVGLLADEIGWSRRHFASRFRQRIGLTPKATGRVLRFTHAVDLLERAGTIAEVAATCGYADHSHLDREFNALAGCTPSELVAARLPDAGGIAG
ncbi:MAG: helix-turn-helix transcriptional regulator [Acidimicrobiia bacterium]